MECLHKRASFQWKPEDKGHIQKGTEDKEDYACAWLRAPEGTVCWRGVRDGNGRMNIQGLMETRD